MIRTAHYRRGGSILHKFGNALPADQVLCEVLSHNICAAVQVMHELGTEPAHCRCAGTCLVADGARDSTHTQRQAPQASYPSGPVVRQRREPRRQSAHRAQRLFGTAQFSLSYVSAAPLPNSLSGFATGLQRSKPHHRPAVGRRSCG
jgi:hypothetical protein